MNWRTRIEPFTRPLFFAFSRLTRGMTLGVRGIAVDAEGRVLLVRHTYLHGWWLPGGGVERGQACEQALVREMREEAGVIVEGRPVLVSVHSNERFFRGDHVLVYRIDRFSLTERTSHGRSPRSAGSTLQACPRTRTGPRGRVWPRRWAGRMRRWTGENSLLGCRVDFHTNCGNREGCWRRKGFVCHRQGRAS